MKHLIIYSAFIALFYTACLKKKCELLPGPGSGTGTTGSTGSTSGSGTDCASLLKSGMTVYLPFNGNAGDSSGNSNHGKVNGAVLTKDRFGNPGKAYHFDGDVDYIDLGADPSIKRFKQDYSFTAWIKPEAYSSSYNTIIISNRNKSTSPVSGSFIGIGGNSSNLGFYKKLEMIQESYLADIYSFDFIGSNNEVPLGQWLHIAVTYKHSGNGEDDVKFYINGILDSAHLLKEGIDPEDGSTYLGFETGFQLPEYSFLGDMDEVRIYNRVLSPCEIEILAE